MAKKRYPEGTRICLDRMNDDPFPVESGTLGKVDHVDDIGTVHCVFDNGRTLGVIPDVDKFHKIEQEQAMADEQEKSEEITETEGFEESEEMEMSM